MVGPGGLEPPTPRLSSACSNQLSYEPIARQRVRDQSAATVMVEPTGIEPVTSCLQSRRSTN